MNKEIRTEILDCYENRKIFSTDFIKYFTSYFATKMGLNEAVKFIECTKSSDYGSYSRKYKKVNIFYRTILKKELDKMSTTVEQATETQMYIVNLKILEVIFHELAHAEQYLQSKKIHPCSSTIKTILETDDKIGTHRTHLYQDHYNDFISEYNANFVAQVQLHDLLQDELYPELSYSYDTNKSMLNFLNCRYLGEETPFERFERMDSFFKTGFSSELHSFDDLSEFDKLSYGIAVSEETKQKVKQLTIAKPINYPQYFL